MARIRPAWALTSLITGAWTIFYWRAWWLWWADQRCECTYKWFIHSFTCICCTIKVQLYACEKFMRFAKIWSLNKLMWFLFMRFCPSSVFNISSWLWVYDSILACNSLSSGLNHYLRKMDHFHSDLGDLALNLLLEDPSPRLQLSQPSWIHSWLCLDWIGISWNKPLAAQFLHHWHLHVHLHFFYLCTSF